jgi:hypothetical protein
MRSYGKCTISAADVQAVATDWIQSCLQFSDYSRKCTVWVMLSVLLFAASRRRSVSEACQRLKDVPSDETFRKALWATLPPQSELEDRLNRGLGDHLPKPFFRRGQRVAVDFTLIPYHGQAHRDEAEIRRGKPKAGTTHFHAYATAYVVQHGQRYTLAMTYVFQDESPRQVLQRLMWKVQNLGVKVRFLLLDKEFFNAEVVRYLQAARYPFLTPAFPRGRKPKELKPGSLGCFRFRGQSNSLNRHNGYGDSNSAGVR